jgi:hypothetical protein
VLDSDVVEIAVGAVVDREVQAQLGLPPCPEAAQDTVSREVVEEPVEAKVRVDAGRDVVLLRGPVELLDGSQQLRPLRTTQRFGRELGGVMASESRRLRPEIERDVPDPSARAAHELSLARRCGRVPPHWILAGMDAPEPYHSPLTSPHG